MDRAGIGKLHDTIPLVAGTAERAVLFPAPDLHQRVQRLDTGCIEQWDGTEWAELLCAGDGGGGGDTFVQAQYVVMALSDDLTLERRLQVGAGLTLTDGGANGDVTLSVPCPNYCGNGSPESVVTAAIGSWYLQRDAASTTHPLWAKRTGAGNTGWVAWAGLRGAGAGSLAVGDNAAAAGIDAIALGENTTASGLRAEAIGKSSSATGTDSKAFGAGATAAAATSIAIGALATVNTGATSGIAIGPAATVTASATGGIAIGDGNAQAPNDIVVGTSATVGQVLAHPNVVIGKSAAIGTTADSSSPTPSARGGHVVIGENASAGMGPSAFPNTIIGRDASSVGRAVVAIGQGAQARAADTPVAGRDEGRFAVAIGYLAKVSGGCVVAIGDNTDTRSDNSASVGTHAKAYDTDCAAIGPNAFAGSVTSDNTGGFASALGTSAQALAAHSIAIGPSTVQNNANYAVAIGSGALVATTHDFALALGRSATTTTPQQLMIGDADTPILAVHFNGSSTPGLLIDVDGRVEVVTGGSGAGRVLPLASSPTLGDTDRNIFINSTAASRTVTLPAHGSVDAARKYYIRKDTAANLVTVTPNGADTIDGDPTFVLTNKWDYVLLQNGGGAWSVEDTNV